MRELALHLLDIAENSVAAGARNITIAVVEDVTHDRLRLQVIDDGRGMDAETVAHVVDPFFTSRTTRKVGLGLPLLKAAAEACAGFLTIDSTVGVGTTVTVEFQRSHIDRMPLGDYAGTCFSLLIAVPEVHWVFRYRVGEQEFVLDDAPLKQELEGISFTEPEVIAYLRAILNEGISGLQAQPANA